MKVKAKIIWKIFIDAMRDADSSSAREAIWSLCNDFIMWYPELEGEEELQKQFVELYETNKEKKTIFVIDPNP